MNPPDILKIVVIALFAAMAFSTSALSVSGSNVIDPPAKEATSEQ